MYGYKLMMWLHWEQVLAYTIADKVKRVTHKTSKTLMHEPIVGNIIKISREKALL